MLVKSAVIVAIIDNVAALATEKESYGEKKRKTERRVFVCPPTAPATDKSKQWQQQTMISKSCGFTHGTLLVIYIIY